MTALQLRTLAAVAPILLALLASAVVLAQTASPDPWGTGEEVSRSRGSAFVALDSWMYPAFDRLAALGYAPSAIAGLRPWTRRECARLLAETADLLEAREPGEALEARQIYDALSSELAGESRGQRLSTRVETVYARFSQIAGPPLSDGYHFGQTLMNDYGRPYGRGSNLLAGASARAQVGPLAAYVRGEYQQAPGFPAYSEGVRIAIANSDANPIQPAAAGAAVRRMHLLEGYIAIAFGGLQLSLGKQSLWWGPGRGGPLMMTNNAEPMLMLRLGNSSPKKLPGWLSAAGPYRSEFFFGKLEGHHFPPGGYIHGQKFSVKPSPNLELGFSRTVIFAGGPQPLTWGTFFDSFVSTSTGNPDPRYKPGDKRGGFDFTYHIPGLRDWLVLYNDSLVDDDPTPLATHRGAMNPGIYLPRIPKAPKLDFRLESVYTDVPASRSINGQFIYWEYIYHDGYTNRGNLLGNWIGREGRGFQAWSTYWLSPESTVQLLYRRGRVARDFLGGGALDDVGLRADLAVRPQLRVTALMQFESWNYPWLAVGRQSNFTAAVEFTYTPKWAVH
jgi:hypothetical protein